MAFYRFIYVIVSVSMVAAFRGEAFINVCQGLLGAALALPLFIGILTSNEERAW